MFARPTVCGAHAGLIRAIGKSPALRRKIVASTQMLVAGDSYEGGYTIESVLGHGMVGVAYRARRANGEVVVLKVARARHSLFERLLQAEACAAEMVHAFIPVAAVMERHPHALVKELVEGPTLQRMLFVESTTPEARRALMAVLRAARVLRDEHRFYLDPSPKNLAWRDGAWVVLDPGQPLLRPDFDALLDAPDFERYRSHFESKLTSPRSEPSALASSDAEVPRAGRYAFLRDWDLWIPDLDPIADDRELLADIDEAVGASEIVAYVHRRPDGWVFEAAIDDQALVARAKNAWLSEVR